MRQEEMSHLLRIVRLTAIVIGSVVFAYLCQSEWRDADVVVASFLAGATLGFGGGRIGAWTFSIALRRRHGSRASIITRMGSAAAAGAIGLLAGAFVSLLFSGFIWEGLVYGRHPEREYGGDIQNLGTMVYGALLTAAFGLLHGSGLFSPKADGS